MSSQTGQQRKWTIHHHAQAQDDLENIVAQTRLSMGACTKPTNDFKENTSPSKQQQPCRGVFPHLEMISPQHRNDDDHEGNFAGQTQDDA